jgi:ribonuclease HI
MEPGPAMEG